MKYFVTSILLLCTAVLIPEAHAQLPGGGNVDWQQVWVNYPPSSANPSNPNFWMYGDNNYTGLAYDRFNDVLYVVSPGTCDDGGGEYNCPRIFAWNADDGTLDSSIGNRSLSPPGQLFVDETIVQGGFSGGRYSIYKIDLDDDGRIYAANVVAPLWGICYPGPPPACSPEYLAQGPYKVYRWDTHTSSPELVFKTEGSGQLNTTMTWNMWGTAFDVVSGMRTVNGQQYDSTRIYTSGGLFYNGYVAPNDEINVIVKDDRPSAVTPFRLGVKMNNSGNTLASHGIAAAGPFKNSDVWMDSNAGAVYKGSQDQDTSSMPQLYTMSTGNPLPFPVTQNSGAINFFVDLRWNYSYLICADGMPTSTDTAVPNLNTRCRAVALDTGPNYHNWPQSDTPPVGNKRLHKLTGEDNWISDVDHKVWVNPETGIPHMQVFVLMSNNGIACYRSRWTWPPVEMTIFRGLLNGNNIDLSWQVAAETNNHGFEVHRSFNNGADWEKIGFVEGRGTSTSAAEYSFSDALSMVHKSVGVVQYRLRQVDFDGTYEWSNAIDVYFSGTPSEIVLFQNYPNPFNPSTKISYQIQKAGFVTLKVFNTIGDEVASLVQEQKDAGLHIAEFDASHLPSGTYMYQLNVNGKLHQKKMVLMK